MKFKNIKEGDYLLDSIGRLHEVQEVNGKSEIKTLEDGEYYFYFYFSGYQEFDFTNKLPHLERIISKEKNPEYFL